MKRNPNLKTFAENHIPPGVMTLGEVCEAFDILKFDDEGEVTDSTLYGMNLDNIDERALYSVCYTLGYDYDERKYKVTKKCPPCNGSGEIEAVTEDGATEWVNCPACAGHGTQVVDIEALKDTPEFEAARTEYEDSLFEGWRKAVTKAMCDFLKPYWLQIESVQIRRTYENKGRHFWYEEAVIITPQIRTVEPGRSPFVQPWKQAAAALFEVRYEGYPHYANMAQWYADEGAKSYKALVLKELPGLGHDEDKPGDLYHSAARYTLDNW